MTDDTTRSLELEIEVPGTPEEVWRAIATGPGISSWYVPHTVEERTGGAATASFGAAPEMTIHGRVVAWEPPRRIVFDGGEGVDGPAFEWLVEARDGATCIVRLVQTGFAAGPEGDAQYDAMQEGWGYFLRNLQLHLTHFAGRDATPALPMAMWPGAREDVWSTVTEQLGIPASPALGARVEVAAPDSPTLAGTVVDAGPRSLALLVDQPAPGTAFIAAEGPPGGDATGVSIWSYLYDDEGKAAAERDGTLWQAWLDARALPAG